MLHLRIHFAAEQNDHYIERHGYPETVFFDISYSPVRDETGAIAGVLCIVAETTARVLAERRQSFRLTLERCLRDLSDPRAIVATAQRMLGDHLKASRVGYGNFDPAELRYFTTESNWTDGTVASHHGIHDLAAFGPEILGALRRGETLAVHDVNTDPRTATPDILAAHASIDTAAGLVATLVKDGRMRAALYVHQRVPRRWTEDEVALVEDVAESTWAPVERARAEASTKQSEERLNAALAIAQLGTFEWNVRTKTVALDTRSREIFGFIPGEGTHEREVFDRIDPRDFGRVFAQAQASIAAQSRLEIEYRIKLPDGTIRTIASVSDAVPGPDGRAERLIGVFKDVTERRQTENALRQSEARFEAIANSIDQMIWSTRPDGHHDYYNQRWYEYTGVPVGTTDGEAWNGMFHPDDQARAWTVWRHSLATGEPYRIEYRLRHRSGQYRWVLGRAQPVCDDRGEIVRWYGTCTDIHDLKLARDRQAFLLALGDRLRAVADPVEATLAAAEAIGREVDAARAGYGEIDEAGEIVRVERDWTRDGGVASLAGEARILDGFGPAVIDELRAGHTLVVEDCMTDPRVGPACAATWASIGCRALIVVPLVKAGWLRAILYLHEPSPRRWSDAEVSLAEDVANRTWDAVQRARAEEELRRLNESLEAQVAERTAERDRIWQNSNELMGVFGFDGRRRAINPAWTRVLGQDEATLLGLPFMEITHPDDRDRLRQAVERLAAGESVVGFEDRLRHADGSYRTISWTGVPGDDEVFYAIGRDVTEQRQVEEALRQAQKMEAIGQLTGGVAHDFNNLLTIIRSSAEFLRRPNLPEERRRRYVEAITDTVDRASRLTSQLLAFARRQALKPEVFDVADRVRAVSDMLRTIMGSRIRIVTEISCDGCLVEADVAQFETALVNMAVNARDAMEGEGALTVRVESLSEMPPIRGHAGGRGDFVALAIADTGSGIPADRLPHIFEPFFTTKEVGKGTGLGLSQVYGFAKQSGGNVAVESQVGRGTTFTLYLPRVDGELEHATAGAQDERHSEAARGGRILVVEDNVEVGTFSTQILQDLGYETIWAANADEALRLLAETPEGFDAVFSDVVMPGMSGVELGREIRRRYPDLPVVLTSGYSHVLAEGGRHGLELIQKPYAAEELSRVLSRVMRTSASEREPIDGSRVPPSSASADPQRYPA